MTKLEANPLEENQYPIMALGICHHCNEYKCFFEIIWDKKKVDVFVHKKTDCSFTWMKAFTFEKHPFEVYAHFPQIF